MIVGRFLSADTRCRHIPVAAAEVGRSGVVERHIRERNAILTKWEHAECCSAEKIM